MNHFESLSKIFFVVAIVALCGTALCAESPERQKREDQIAKMLDRVPTSAADRETALERQQRRRRIARAIVAASSDPKVRKWLPRRAAAAAIYTIWYQESRFSETVHRGGLSRWGSDDGRAKCMGQLWQNERLPKELWERLPGTDYASTLLCAQETLKRFRSGMGACGGFLKGSPDGWRNGFRGYRGNCTEDFETLEPRTRRALRIMGWIY